MITVIPYNYIVSHYFIEVRLASLVDTDTPRNRADEEERVKANAFLSLSLSLSVSRYCMRIAYIRAKNNRCCRPHAKLAVLAQIRNACACARADYQSAYARTHARAMYMRGGPLSGGNYGNANWPV